DARGVPLGDPLQGKPRRTEAAHGVLELELLLVQPEVHGGVLLENIYMLNYDASEGGAIQEDRVVSDTRVKMERDESAGIARLTLDNPARRNAYDALMREQLGAYLDEIASDDDIKVVLLRGAGGVFSTGADMANSYSWYDKGTGQTGENGGGRRKRPSQRRRLSIDRKIFSFYHNFLGYPKVIVAEVRGFAL